MRKNIKVCFASTVQFRMEKTQTGTIGLEQSQKGQKQEKIMGSQCCLIWKHLTIRITMRALKV